MTIALPARARPQQPGPHKPYSPGSLKQQLVQQIARGDKAGAETTRKLITEEQMRNRVLELEAAANSGPQSSVAHWVSDDGSEESIELTATPEARAYFVAVMNKESKN